MPNIDIEPVTFLKIIIIIKWLATTIGFFYLFTLPNATSFPLKYAAIFAISIILVIVDWILVGKLFGEEDEKVGESLSEGFDSRTAEVNPARYWLHVITQNILIILIISIVIGLVWGAYYMQGVYASKGLKSFMLVPNFFTSVPLSASPVPFVDTSSMTAFAEAWVVADTEEGIFAGLLHPTLVGLFLLGIVRVLNPNKEMFLAFAIIGMIIMAFPAAWVATNFMHFFALQQQAYAYQSANNHFLMANLIDGSVGNTIPSFIAHLMNNYAVKEIKYHKTFQVIPSYSDGYENINPPPIE